MQISAAKKQSEHGPEHSHLRRPQQTGFPSPATDHLERRLSLDEHLIRRPSSTFFARVEGDEFLEFGIHHGDLLMIDRSLTPTRKTISVVTDGDGFQLAKVDREQLRGDPEAAGVEIWGVVSHVIHKMA